jgi:hypothetical protein
MEIFRRLGLVGAVRDAGLPADYPNDVAFRTTATGIDAVFGIPALLTWLHRTLGGRRSRSAQSRSPTLGL